jgi:hypothetical protein
MSTPQRKKPLERSNPQRSTMIMKMENIIITTTTQKVHVETTTATMRMEKNTTTITTITIKKSTSSLVSQPTQTAPPTVLT